MLVCIKSQKCLSSWIIISLTWRWVCFDKVVKLWIPVKSWSRSAVGEGREETRSSVTDWSNQLWLTLRLRTSLQPQQRFSVFIPRDTHSAVDDGESRSCCTYDSFKVFMCVINQIRSHLNSTHLNKGDILIVSVIQSGHVWMSHLIGWIASHDSVPAQNN